MFRVSLGRVHELVRIKEGTERLLLRVDGDPIQMTIGLNKARELLQTLTDENDEEALAAARMFAEVFFGKKQTELLIGFYNDNPACVISVCGKIFEKRLIKKIIKAQKRQKRK